MSNPDIAARITVALLAKYGIVYRPAGDVVDRVSINELAQFIRDMLTNSKAVVIEPQTAQEAIHEALEAPLPTWNEIKAGMEQGQIPEDTGKCGKYQPAFPHEWTTAALLEEKQLFSIELLPPIHPGEIIWWESIIRERQREIYSELQKRCLARLEQLRDQSAGETEGGQKSTIGYEFKIGSDFRPFAVVIDGDNPPKKFYGKIVGDTFVIDPEQLRDEGKV